MKVLIYRSFFELKIKPNIDYTNSLTFENIEDNNYERLNYFFMSKIFD